ncbi:MAG: hypothetical protein HY240_07920 [Actinobacteria bacterium]|nr:hypothetical protein [Actinomycetota bacterium]
MTLVAALLLAFTLPDREPKIIPCPPSLAGQGLAGCDIRVDHRMPERIAIVAVGAGVAVLLIAASRRMSRRAGETPPS